LSHPFRGWGWGEALRRNRRGTAEVIAATTTTSSKAAAAMKATAAATTSTAAPRQGRSHASTKQNNQTEGRQAHRKQTGGCKSGHMPYIVSSP
jgi:hypothetical protein